MQVSWIKTTRKKGMNSQSVTIFIIVIEWLVMPFSFAEQNMFIIEGIVSYNKSVITLSCNQHSHKCICTSLLLDVDRHLLHIKLYEWYFIDEIILWLFNKFIWCIVAPVLRWEIPRADQNSRKFHGVQLRGSVQAVHQQPADWGLGGGSIHTAHPSSKNVSRE